MSQIKNIMAEQEAKKQRKLEGYRNKLRKENNYNMDCPYCCNALSDEDLKKEQCIHCGYTFQWNV